MLAGRSFTDHLKNRVTAHTATADWTTGERRHLARITPQAEAPYETPYVTKEIPTKVETKA